MSEPPSVYPKTPQIAPHALPRRDLGVFGRFFSRLLLTPVALYQRLISPALPRRCKYEPTCSAYAVHAVREYGILRGLVLAAWRLSRCNPWSHGGYDPVAAQRLFAVRHDARARRGHGRDAGVRTGAGDHGC